MSVNNGKDDPGKTIACVYVHQEVFFLKTYYVLSTSPEFVWNMEEIIAIVLGSFFHPVAKLRPTDTAVTFPKCECNCAPPVQSHHHRTHSPSTTNETLLNPRPAILSCVTAHNSLSHNLGLSHALLVTFSWV